MKSFCCLRVVWEVLNRLFLVFVTAWLSKLLTMILPASKCSCFSMTTIVIICIVLAAVTAVFFGCYFLLRFIHRALGADGRKHTLPYSNVVIHSKRVYEIQAEEGCFTGPPDIHDPVEEPNKPYVLYFSMQCSLKKPETGDLKTIRQEHEVEDPRQMLRRKEKKVGSSFPIQLSA
ncbi:unnamed protein product [Heligmosomoides polygyrus]|uniref:Uncharacterized protein n=1 Tax=Heligmosomoides polygyrus TaxID=6339 RepID=A0A3P7WZ45_HELPZ|nr:unnamed protein product [Heligmosomoides polygyrus]